MLCAITVLEARFVNITERSPIDLSAIPLPRFRLVRLQLQLVHFSYYIKDLDKESCFVTSGMKVIHGCFI